MTTRVRPAVLALVCLLALLAPAGVATQPAVAAEDAECSNQVVYDAFRFDDEIVSEAANGSATATAQNTQVTVEQNAGFIRLNATNPNGYCVEFHVRLNDSIVSPAELGEVTSNDDHYSAEWHAVPDFQRDETYTDVVFTLPAGTQAVFAPSKLRVETLSWTGAAKSEGSGLWHSVTSAVSDDDEPLEQRTYTFQPTDATDRVTVSLTDEETGRTVEEWDAMYRTSNESGWRPVSTDSEAPVFYRQVDDEHVQFVFNDPSAEVKFTANPTTLDKASSSWESWRSGVDVVDNVLEDLFGE